MSVRGPRVIGDRGGELRGDDSAEDGAEDEEVEEEELATPRNMRS